MRNCMQPLSSDGKLFRVFRPCAVILALLGGGLDAGSAFAAPPAANQDESKVRPYTLPDALVCLNGTPVRTAQNWTDIRRPELLKSFTELMFGKAPPAPQKVDWRVVSEKKDALGGLAIRKEIEVVLADQPKPVVMTMLLYIPRSQAPAPVFWGLNFRGNHAITAEPDVALNPNWNTDKAIGVVNHRATDEARGTNARRWPLEDILRRGYAVATAYYGDIDPDFDDGFQNGIHPAFYREGQTAPAPDEWGTIAAWAWGLSRGLDVLEQEPLVDARHVAVLGHSRLGKTALWAGASDPRFAMVISNDSGCGGASLSRRNFGESIARLNKTFPYWMCGNFKQFSDRETELPFDQHELIALIAPRPVCIGSAEQDLWADPKGEFLSGRYADPVYRLLGTTGMGGKAPPEEMPAVGHPLIAGPISYHIRAGKHDLILEDWEVYLDMGDRYLKNKPANP